MRLIRLKQGDLLQIVKGECITNFKAPFTGGYIIAENVPPHAIFINGEQKKGSEHGYEQENDDGKEDDDGA